MYLLDTSIVLEFLLDQEKADEVEQFLHSISLDSLYLTKFSLYSIGVILSRHKRHDVFLRAVDDLFLSGGIRLLQLRPEDMEDVIRASRRFSLDFDDAYQYTAAEKYNLTVVSFDGDFDRTERGRRTTEEILKEISNKEVKSIGQKRPHSAYQKSAS